MRSAEELVNQSRSTQKPQSPQRRNAKGNSQALKPSRYIRSLLVSSIQCLAGFAFNVICSQDLQASVSGR